MATVLIRSDARYEINRKRLRSAVLETLTQQGMGGNLEVSVMIVGDRKMRSLNSKYRKVHETTDVLAFPFETSTPFVQAPDQVQRLGDVVISYPQAVRQAASENQLVDEEVDTLVQHGTMHLLGFDHAEGGEWYFVGT